MAGRTPIPVQALPILNQATVTWLAADAVNGMSFINDGQTVLLVRNDAGTAGTVTVESTADQYGRKGDVIIAASAETGSVDNTLAMTNTLPTGLFNQGGGNQAFVDIASPGTGLFVAAVRLAPRQ